MYSVDSGHDCVHCYDHVAVAHVALAGHCRTSTSCPSTNSYPPGMVSIHHAGALWTSKHGPWWRELDFPVNTGRWNYWNEHAQAQPTSFITCIIA